MGVTYQARINSYFANFDGHQYAFAVGKYGPLAKELAERSFKERKRIINIIDIQGNYAVLKVWSNPYNTVYDVLIDIDDIPKVENFKWYINTPQNSRTLYVANDQVGKMHRHVLNVTDPWQIVDHLTRNGLDNRKCKLRIVNTSINKRNELVHENNKCGYNGVHYEPPCGNHAGRFKAVWNDQDGGSHSKSFSERKYANAQDLPIAYRKQMERENGYLSSEE